MNNNEVRIGFIGCGNVSEYHFISIKKCPKAKLIAVSDINEERAREKARRWGVEFISADKICSTDEIDVVFVLTTTASHYSYTKQALLNRKHVLVEKPVSMIPEEIDDMKKLSLETGRICFPGHSYIYLPELARMKHMIAEGFTGIPSYMYFSEIQFVPKEMYSIYHGPLYDAFYHQLYLMLAYMGKPTKLQAFVGKIRQELPTDDEQVSVNVAFENGANAQLFSSWGFEDECSDSFSFKLKVNGKKGGLHFSKRDMVNINTGGKTPWGFPIYQEMIDHEVLYFINKCILNNEMPISTLTDASVSAKLLNLIISSSNKDRVEYLLI